MPRYSAWSESTRKSSGRFNCTRWPELETTSSPHFFGHDVGFFPDSPDEQFGRLEDWRTDLVKRVRFEHRPHFRLDGVPQMDVRREDVVGTAN